MMTAMPLALCLEVPLETVERARHARVLQEALVDQLRTNALLCVELQQTRFELALAQGRIALADRAGREAVADRAEERQGTELGRRVHV